MSLEECTIINNLMANFNQLWFVASGWAIDFHIGKETRVHKDIEIAVFRNNQLQLKE